MSTSCTFELGGRQITLETGELARQADGAVVVRSGRALVLVTVLADETHRTGVDFLPLTVEYREKSAAAGRLPGGFRKREGRISDHEVLVSRLIDRSVRPLFPRGWAAEVQLQATVYSADPLEVETSVLALIGAGAALHVSAIPWEGPAAGVRVAELGGRSVVLPAPPLLDGSDLDLMVAASPGGLVMLEGGGRQVPEARVQELIGRALRAMEPCFAALTELQMAAGQPKRSLPASPPADQALRERVEEMATTGLASALALPASEERRRRLAEIAEQTTKSCARSPEEAGQVAHCLRELKASLIRRRILDEGVRSDGRGPRELREISGRSGWLPATHGSALFTRGQTQAIATCTLASPQSEAQVETLAGLVRSRFLLHYNFPPFSVGEIRPLRGPGRREIGHGHLAQRALEPLLPSAASFPYVIRLDVDITESSGSSSMATVCAGSLALLDAGVPLAESVAGVAMGLVTGPGKTVVLTDILGEEDHVGEMDFKVAGTRRGVTAIQLDNKVGALSPAVLEEALEQAREGRHHILTALAGIREAPRPEVAAGAPRASIVRVQPDAIGSIIGAKGATIRSLQSEFGVDISVGEGGVVSIFSPDAAAGTRAAARIRQMAGVVEAGKLYQGRITGVKEFGVFVRIYDTVEGLVHISEWDQERVETMAAVAREGDRLVVRVLGADPKGRLRLSRRAALGAGAEPVENA